MTQSHLQTPMQNLDDSNFRANFDNFTLTEDPGKMSAETERKIQYRGGPVSSGPILYT
jgi:hypothetical protein